MRLSLNLLLVIGLIFGGLWLTVIPWQTRVALPAVLRAADYATLYPPMAGRLVEMTVFPGEKVSIGTILYRLEVPDLEQRLILTRKRINLVGLHLKRHVANPEELENLPALQQELATLLSDESGLLAQRETLTIRAPFTGIATDLPPERRLGLWVKPDQCLGRIVSLNHSTIQAYLADGDLDRIQIGSTGNFLPEDPARPTIPVVITNIEQVNAALLDVPALASTQGGPIAVQPAKTQPNVLIPTNPVYRVILTAPETISAPLQTVHGTAWVVAQATSPVRHIWRTIISVLIRESGF
ncbi:hypothetical protein CCP2SC5_280010 [Azospirillaceae bacterium]